MTTSGSVRLDHSRLHGFKLVAGAMPGAKIGQPKGEKLANTAVTRQLGAKIGGTKSTKAGAARGCK